MRKYIITFDQKEFEVELLSKESNQIKFRYNNKDYEVSIEGIPSFLESKQTIIPITNTSSNKKNACNIICPIPGRVLQLFIVKGDIIRKGTKIAVVEAMKMENPIYSEIDGKIAEIRVGIGNDIKAKSIIATIE